MAKHSNEFKLAVAKYRLQEHGENFSLAFPLDHTAAGKRAFRCILHVGHQPAQMAV